MLKGKTISYFWIKRPYFLLFTKKYVHASKNALWGENQWNFLLQESSHNFFGPWSFCDGIENRTPNPKNWAVRLYCSSTESFGLHKSSFWLKKKFWWKLLNNSQNFSHLVSDGSFNEILLKDCLGLKHCIYRLFYSHKTMAHPPSRGSITANVWKSSIIIMVRSAKWHFFYGLIN